MRGDRDLPITREMLRAWADGVPFHEVGDQFTPSQRSQNLVYGCGALLDRIETLSGTVAAFRAVLGVDARASDAEALRALEVLLDERSSLVSQSVLSQAEHDRVASSLRQRARRVEVALAFVAAGTAIALVAWGGAG